MKQLLRKRKLREMGSDNDSESSTERSNDQKDKEDADIMKKAVANHKHNLNVLSKSDKLVGN